ncbi:transcription-repair coupling factor [Marvinbryantia formatexigens DSM 14469]|uniref:Transcription-repair-coupling factor n=1 Tax=Marvinbryantia formatexigens DSM 14469 TaxID=478749 RepID=C6LDP8_9FIRM|nr:transcription-repair coupling factor [Marvinbryantia formatexigens]EET61102.1 transcription-repair coupling factor [Marvinbryantia formatexigens DSM 14469]UWO23686.1 transcription-repair coupling factor [Marvinbryantia formatexigens DSM 14469]SDF66303.1 transcription-repair coupling factor [Marvinbryantia formatexigens]
MKAFTAPLKNLEEFEQLCSGLKKNRGILQVSGCIEAQKSHLMYSVGEPYKKKLIITYSELRAKEIYENYRFFDSKVLLYPARDLMFYSADIRSHQIGQQRMAVLQALLEEEQVTVITTLPGCMEHVLPLSCIRDHVLEFAQDSELNPEKLSGQLIEMGYEKTVQVDAPGQFAVRGGIVDIFPLTEENPVRIELWGDEIDSIRSFDAESQRSIENLETVRIYPAGEAVISDVQAAKAAERIKKESKKQEKIFRDAMKTEEAHRVRETAQEVCERLLELKERTGLEAFTPYLYEETVSFLDYFGTDALIMLDEPNRIAEEGRAVQEEFSENMKSRLEKGYILPGQTGILYGQQQIIGELNRRNCLALCIMDLPRDEWNVTGRYSMTVRSISSYNSSFEQLVKDLKRWKKEGYRVALLCASRTRAMRLAEDLREHELNSFFTEDMDREIQPGEILLARGNTHKGYEYPLIRFAVITESDIFGKEKKRRKKQRRYEGTRIASFAELNVGDYVVHESHGLGIYRGIEKIEVDHVMKDYMKIEYSGGSNLYVLATQSDVIQKYAGSEAKTPKLNRLGTQEWNKTRTRVRAAVQNIAKDLVALYSQRQNQKGFAYGPDTVWQREFEEMFEFEETDDQLAAIEATKRDMESTKIMDRLICGDVGFGKTEIAIRAAFKAVQEGKQVVYLVPTTILAQQHYNTFVQRMKDFPVRVDLLCRFRTPAEQKKTLVDLKKGLVDILIGTHRVLSKDVEYKDLGLLVIDEEQRFGVTHKEKIKQLKTNVDVLTLTATPIPRTLHMSLIGIRDMSVLEEPPMERTAIQTYVMEYNEEMVREAISRELARGGQVYYVYNRVNTIVEMTNKIAKLLPEANVAFAHGQMKERELERIMYDFINGDIDVLVSTTIIETGLDISNVNTMIIHDADTMGLSQLYQLRGRVGRSNRTAYAFLMYRRNKMLKEVAEKRLHAIREFTELGSGIKIAMRDLEIRGAGNLLGAEQHGHMEAVGYDLYCKMLNESVRELKGEADPTDTFETTIDLDIDAYIPEKYIRNEYQKLDIYKRIAAIENQEEYDDMLEELMDRFGEPPRAVQNLLAIAHLKAVAHRAYVTELTQKGDFIKFVMYEKTPADPRKIESCIAKHHGRMKFVMESSPYFLYTRGRVTKKNSTDVLALTRELLEDIGGCLAEKYASE